MMLGTPSMHVPVGNTSSVSGVGKDSIRSYGGSHFAQLALHLLAS